MPTGPAIRLAMGGGIDAGAGVNYSARRQLLEVRNLREFAGILALDKWTCNINGRQADFSKKPARAPFAQPSSTRATFSCRDWKFIDASLGGVYADNTIYREVTRWRASNPGLAASRAWPQRPVSDRGMHSAGVVWWRSERPGGPAGAAAGTPCAGARVLVAFRESARKPFPNWGAGGEKIARRGLPGAGVGRYRVEGGR